MASAQLAYEQINEIQSSIAATLQRCGALPGLDSVRLDRIADLRSRSNDLTRQAAKAYSDIGKADDATVAVDAASKALSDATLEVQRVQEAIQRAQLEQRRIQISAQAVSDAAGDVQARAAAAREIQEATKRYNSQVQELALTQQEQQLTIADLTRAREQRQQALVKRLQELREQTSPDLDPILHRIRELLDEVGQFERDVQGSVGSFVRDVVKADFSTKRQAFSDAANYHQKQTALTLWFLGLIVLLGAAAIYFLFLVPPMLTNGVGAKAPDFQKLESIVLIGVGRIAVLVLVGIAFRYLTQLHRAHSEQLIVYRDRVAVLGVAETILDIAPYDKKVEFLRLFSDSYLNFEQNAFRVGRDRKSSLSPSIDDGAQQIRSVLESLKPAFDLVRTVTSQHK